ncbi:iron-sulfur cluster assembly protein, partial [Clostridioides difficile]
MLSKEQILELLQPLQEPQLGVSLTELEWFRDIMVKENHVALTIV